MIHIIGTAHCVQVRSNVIRDETNFGPDETELRTLEQRMLDEFEKYLEEAAIALGAGVVAEKLSEEGVLRAGPTASSLAKDLTERLGIAHVYCDPNTKERRAIGLKSGQELLDYVKMVASQTGQDVVECHHKEVRKGFKSRENVWVERLKRYKPNEISLVFVCGADHVDTFKAALDREGLAARIHCRDWTELEAE